MYTCAFSLIKQKNSELCETIATIPNKSAFKTRCNEVRELFTPHDNRSAHNEVLFAFVEPEASRC